MATEEPTIPSSLSSRREDIRDLAARTLQSAWRRSVGKEDERTILEHTLLTNLRAVQIRRERIENKARNERRHAERNCAAQRIQRALSVFSDRLREEKLRSRAEKFETCARCFAAKPTHYVFDLTQAFCLACVEALSRDLVNRDYALTRRGVFVGIAMELERKRAADAAASRLQKWWRNLAKAALLKNGACSLCTSRAATHVDHGLHERLLCRRCAGLAIMTLCRQNASRNSRIQSLVDRDRDYRAGCVVQHFFLRAHRVRRWLATERAYLALSIRAATTIERNLRGKIIRNIVRTCDASLHLLFASMKARFQRNPGMWVLHLHVAVLSNVPRFLVGEHLWIAAGEPVFYKRHATMMYVTESAALMISRVVRGSAGKRQLQKLRDKAERWRVEIEVRYIARQESATQSLQRAARGFVARCQKSRRIGRKIAAMQVADRACNVQERCADAAAIWKSHQGFLGACTLSPEAILGGSLGLFPHTLRDAVADQCVPCMTLGTITKRLQERVSHNSWTNALVGGELTVALAVSPYSRAYAKPSQQEDRVEREGGTAPSFETLPQCPVRLPLVLILQVIHTSDRGSIFVSWCGEDIGCSSDDEGPLTIGAGRFAERQSTFYLSCDAKRHPRFFRQRDSPLLTLSTTSAEHARMTATDLLCGLGTRRTLQVSKTNVTILVSVEPTARTETRSVVSSVVASVLNDVIHQVAILIPHVKCCLISYQCLLRSNGAGLGNEAIRARLTWNGMDAGDVTIPTFDKERDIFDAQEFVLPVDVARDQAGQAKSKQIDLNIDLASEFGERPWGIARLDDECFEGDGYRTARANVYTHPSTSDFSTPRQQLIGFLHMQTEAFKIPVAPWRQRRGVIEKYVESVVESALERIPQPRVVLTLADATELQTQNENSTIEFRVFWNDTLHSVWRSPNAVGGPLKIKESSTLFLPAHLLFVPDLKIEVFNVKNDKEVECCLGVARVRGSELVKMCGRIDLDLFEPLASTKKPRRMLNVHRVVPGRIGLSIKTIQIPNHLSDPHISLSATQDGDTTSDEPSTFAMVSSITALRLALIDLEIDDNMGTHSSLKRNKNAIEHLFARGNPYAVVRWHHVEVGYEEIMRNSLRSLAADGSFLQSFMAAAAGSNLPRQSNLVFSGTPYSFPLTSDAPRKEFDVNVSIDIYAVEEESLEHSQKKRNRFLGQARLDQWSFDRTSASHLKLPLRRRQSDTLNDAIVHLEIKDVTGTEITITALRAAELSSSGTGLLFHRGDSKVQVRFQLVRFTNRNGQEQRVEVDSAHSSARRISGSCARWPSEEAVALHFPLSEDVEPEKLLKVAVWRLQKPAIQIGSAEWFFPAQGSSIDEIVTLRLSTLHGKPHGSIAFQIRVGEYGARASARSATALNGSFHEPQSPSSTPMTRAKWRNSGGDAENAAITLRIADPRLLRKPLTIAITSKNRTVVGSATFDMKRFAVEKNAATSFETRLENSHEHPDDHKVVRFTAWLERTQYYCLCASRIRLSNMSVSDRPIYVSLRFAESTARTKSISDLGLILNEHTSLQLPASLRQIQRRKLCVEVWLDGDGGDAPSDLLLARSSVSIGSVLVAMENDAPLCLTAPLISRNRRRDECCGMLSLILICTEIKDIREEDFSRGDGVRSALAAMKAPSPPAKARPVALIIGNIKAHNLRTKDSLQCVVRIGQQIARTTVSSSREHHCWRSEVLCIESDIDVVIGGMIEIEVHSQSPSGVLGQSTVYLTPRRFLAFCDDKLRAILGYEQNISDESLTYNKNVAVKLRRFGDSITIALLTFEMHASMEPIQSDARESSQRTPQVPDDHASNVAAIQRSTSKTVAPQRHISFMSMSNEKGLDDAIEGEEKKGRSSVPNVATDKDIPATVNERSNALFWLGGAFRLTNIPHRADDETCISNNEEKLDGNKPESEAEASFLIGKHDDVPETVRVRRQRKRPSKLDRNELRVCVLQGRGIWGGASHPRSEKYRTAKKPSKVHVVLRVVGDDDTSPSQKTSAQEGTNPEWNERFVLPAFEPVPHENGNMQNTASLLALEILVKGRESREIYGTAAPESLRVNSFVGTGLVPLEGPDAPAGIKEGKILRRWILLRDRSCGRRTVASQTMQDEPRPSSLWGNNACRKMNDYSLDAGAVQIAMRWCHDPDKSFLNEGCQFGKTPPNMFRVAVVRGRGLRGGDRRSLFRSGRVVEPVVKARIKAGNGVLMDEAETRAKNQSSNPVWNSVFDFELEHTEICDDGSAPKLELLVEDAAMYSKNRFVGQAVIPLAPFRNKVREKVWVPLQSRDDQCKGAQRGDNRGELLIFACWVFDPAVSIHKRFSAQDARHSMHAVNDLQIVLIRARGLPVSTKNSKSNVVAALRVGAESWRSLTKQRTQHPKWYETCSLAVHRCDEQKAKLEVTIYDSDQNARDIFIGRVSLPLAPLLNQSNEYFRAWRPLESEDLSYRGEVELAMRWIFNPSKAFFEDIPNGGKQAPNMLHVAIVQARELPLSDAYVSLELNDRRMACTSFQPHTTMPAWREFFAFPVTRAMAEEREEEDTHRLLLSFKVLDSKRHNSILGVCHVDILGELSNRELVRSWRKLSSLKGEIEIELFWTFDKEAEPLEPEPLHRLHFRDISAHILRSSSDSVLEGAASVGVLAKLVEPRSNDNAGAGDFFATCRLRILKLSGLRESSVGPRVLVKVTQNGREIHRAELNRLPSSCQKSDHISLSIFKGENAEHVDNIVVELWKDSVDVGVSMGTCTIPTSDFLDEELAGTERVYPLSDTKCANLSIVGTTGSLVVSWDCGSCKETIEEDENKHLETLLSLSDVCRDDDKEENVEQYPYLMTATELSAVGLPETEVGAVFGIGRQDLYVRASIGDCVSKTSILRNAGKSGVWDAGEIFTLHARTSWLQDGPRREDLVLKVMNSNFPLPDTLVGEGRVCILEHWSTDDQPHVLSLSLSRPGKGEYGTISLGITLKSKRANRCQLQVAEAARQERQVILSALKRSVKLATLSWQQAERAVESGTDPAKRADLRYNAARCKREVNRTKNRLLAAKALSMTAYVERVQRRMDRSELLRNMQARREAEDLAAIAARDDATANAVALRTLSYLRNLREYCHVKVTIEIDPQAALGIVWGDVDSEELNSLANGQSGFESDASEIGKANKAIFPTMRGPSAQRSDITTLTDQHRDDLPRGKRALELKLKSVESELAAISGHSRMRSRLAAAEAGPDLRVTAVLPESQSAAQGVRVGWRAVALDDVVLKARHQLEEEILRRKARLENGAATERSFMHLSFTRRVTFRTERHRLRTLRQRILCEQKERAESDFAKSMRKKRITFKLGEKPLGITWTQATLSPGDSAPSDVLEVRHSRIFLYVSPQVVNVDPNSTASMHKVRGGWILTHLGGVPISKENEFTETLSNLRATSANQVDIDFLAPRGVDKRLIMFDAQEEFGVTKWSNANAVLEIAPGSQAARLRVCIGWVLLSLNGEQMNTASKSAAPSALAALRREAKSRRGIPNNCPAVFNAASDEIKHVQLDQTQTLLGIKWRVVQEDDEDGALLVVSDAADAIVARSGWKLLKARSELSDLIPRTSAALNSFVNAARKKGNVVELIFDAFDEDPDLKEAGRREQQVTRIDTMINPTDLPFLPVVEPSLYLHIVRGVDLVSFGRPPFVRIFWCGKEIGRSRSGDLDSAGQPHWKRGTESFLLPMPAENNSSFQKSESKVEKELSPNNVGDNNDIELLLEIWTARSTPFAPFCHGQVLLEGSDLIRQCYRTKDDVRVKRPVAFKLMPKKKRNHDEKGSSATSKLFISKAPQNKSEGRPPLASRKDKDQEFSQETLSMATATLTRGSVEEEVSSILLRIDRSPTDCRDALVRLATLAVSGQEHVAPVFVARGAAPLLVRLLSHTKSTADRLDAATACRGLMQHGSVAQRNALIAAGVVPPLLRLALCKDTSLFDAAAEALAALALAIDTGNSSKEDQLLLASSEILANEDDGINTETLSANYASLKQFLESPEEDDASESNRELVEEILRANYWTDFVQLIRHGSNGVKADSARILASIAGTTFGVEKLEEEAKSSVDKVHTKAGEEVILALLNVADSGVKNATGVKTDCLRSLCRLLLRPDIHGYADRRNKIERAEARRIIGSVKQDGSASRETKAWAILLQGCLDRRELNSACAGQKIAQSESLDDWTEEEEVDVSEEEDNTQCTYKLQILYATDLVGADSNLFKRSEETSSDPFCIVLFDGTEVARSAVTHHSLNPIFRAASIEKRAGCFVDVPYEMVFGASTQRESFEYILQVYDYDKVGRGDFLGEVRLSRSDLRDAVGRRVSKALQPAVGGTRNENRFVGGHLHFAAHLLPAETRIELHVVEANDLALPISQVVKASSKQNALLRLGARAIDSVKESLEPSLNPFAICYAGFAVSKFILFLTLNGVRAVEWQRDDGKNNVFDLRLDQKDKNRRFREWCRYSPELRIEIYDMILDEEDQPSKGHLLGQATLRGPEELTPTSLQDNNDFVTLRLVEKSMSVVEDSPRQDTPTAIDGGTLSVRLLLRDAVPCINRWLQKGKDKKFPPPHALIVNILGAQDLSCGNAYVRIWFNDRLMKRRSSFSSQGERDPVRTDVAGDYLASIGQHRKRDEMLLLEAWSQSPDSQFPFQGKGRERFLGECRFYGAMLRNPPSGRFDIPLRPRSGRALEKQNYVGGKLSVQMVPRQSAWQPEDDATQSQRLWTEYIERETNRRKSEEARRTERSNGEKSRTLICLCIEEATGLPLNVVKPWIEIFYNRKRVGLFQAITEECSKQVVSARWNVSLEMTSDDSTVAALNDVWPEIRFKLWRQASSDPVERRGFLGVAIVRGSKSAITQPPLRKAYPPAGHRQKLRLEARENVAADSTESFAGELSVTICTFTEQSFEDTVSSWGINDLPLPGLAFQVFGTKNGCSLSEAFAEIQVDKFSVARSDTQSVDLMRRRLWENADFILPIPSEKLPTRVEVSVNGTGNKVGLLNEKAKTTEKSFKQSKHVMRNLGHSSIVFTSEQTTPYTTEHLLRAKGNRVHSKRMPESKRLQVEGEQYLAEPPIDVDDGPCSLRESAEFAESDFGILLTRTCRKRAWKPPLGTPSARKHSQARLRLTIYGVSNGSHLGSISGSSRTGNVDDGWSFAARYVADERSPTMFESSRGASFLILSPPSNFTGEGELDDSTKRDTREALISLPNTWDAQWQRGHGALLIEIRHHDVTVGYCHVGPDALARVPRHFGQVSISALELKGRFAPSRIRPGCSRFCSRLLQPFATDQKSMLPVRVLQTRIHFQLGLEEITKSDASKLTSIPCCTPSGCVSRLRLLVLGTTELEGSLLNRTLVSVEWSNQLVGTCELGTMSGIGCSSMSRRLFLLPFGNGCVGCPRDGDSLVLRLRSERKSADKVASRVASIRLGWQELKHLNSVRTDFLVSTPCSDSLGNALETVPVELEMLNDRCNSTVCSDLPGHAGVSCAKASISISLVVEESRASVEHILSVQSCSFRDLADTRNSRAPWEGGSRLCASPRHAVGATRMLGGSKDRWLFMNLQLNERVATTPTTHVKEDVFDACRMNRQIVPFTTKQITRLPLPTERPKCNPCEVSLALFDAGEPNLHEWRNSIIVQSYVRRFLAFLVLLRLRDKMMDVERRTRAAEVVQEFARLASIRWREKRQMLSIERATLLAVAAIRIQRIWRRLLALRLCEIVRKAHAEAQARALKEFNAEEDKRRIRNGIILTILGCDNLALANGYASKSNPYVVCTFNGVEVGRTPTQHNTLQPRWDDSEYLLYPLGRPDEETQCVAPSHIAGSEQIDDAKESVSTTPVISVCSNDVLSHQLWLILTSDRQCWEKAVDCASRFWNAKDCAGVAPTNCLVVVRVGERASQTKFERGADGSNRLDLALCLSNSVVVTKCEAGTVTSQPISSVEFIRNRELELELWFEDNSSRKCLTSGIAKYTNTSANLCSVELLMRPDRLESTSMVNSEIQQSRVFGEISLHVANSMSAAMAMATDLRKVKLSTVREENFVVGPERPDPAFLVNFAQCTITDESKVGLPVNSYLRFALGGRHCTSGKFETRESHARWSEMIVIPARYAMDTYKEFGVELVRDSPAGEITLIASTTMPWEPVAGQQWNFSSCQLRASNSNRYFTLCYFVMLTRPGEALPPLPVMNSEFPTSHEEVISKSRQRVELKFYNISAENLPQTEYWGTSFGNKQDPYFVARVGSQFATSSIKNGAGLACEWSNEVVELCFVHEEEKDSTMKELILEIWNDNKPAKDVLIGRALLSATSYLSRLGESQSLRLDLFRPNKCGDRRQGNLSFDLVVDVVRDFFADESLANETTKQMNELRVAVIQARKLRAMDRNIYGRLTSSDPIVTLFCAGERKTTSIKTKSLFPVWNEVFSFNVRLDDPNPSAASLTLDVVVDDWDELTANDFMGQLSIPVVDIHDSLPRRQWYPLQGRSNQKRNLGEIELAIQWRYNPDLDFFESVVEADEHLALPPNELLVAVIRGRDLEAVDRGFFGPASSDPFVRLEIDGEERLTTVKKRTLEPVWLEKFCIPAADTDNACLHLTVLDWDITRAADHMGHVRMDLRQLRNRKVSRRWMSLVGAGGEIEVALRWIHNPEMALFDDSVGRDGDKFPGLTPNCLRVSVVRAENLQTSGFGGICDPYVRLSVVDDEEEDGTEGQRRSSTLCRHSSMTMIGREQSDKKSAERCVLSHAETKIERQTLHPRWYQSFKLWCQAPDEDGNDLSDLCPRLELRAFDGSEGAFASVLGSSTIDLGGFLDRKRCRFWTPLKNNSTASNSQIEIVLQWVFDPEFKPDTVARVTQVKLYNVGGACGETVSDLFATFAIAGFNSARAPAAPVVTSQLDVSWEDLDLILYGTRDALTTGHIEMKLWGGGSNKILLGRASLSCNHAVFKRCSENTTVHGAIDMESCEAVVPPPKVEVMLTLCPYTLQFARVMRKRKVPELVFDVFDGDNHGGPDIFLGRAFLRGAQLAAASTVRCVSSCGKYPSPSTQPVKLKLHAKDAYSKNSLKVRGTITVSLLAGRDLEFLRRTRKYEKKAIEDIDDDHTPINSVATIRNLVETVVVDSAWKRMYQGRPLTLHIVGARGLYAPRRIKKKKMADARNALVGLSTKVDDCTALLPSPYVVVNWNSTEACRTETTQTTSNPCWNVQICLQPINHDTDASADVLIFDVYDDEEEHRPQGIEGAFLGRFSLSLAQIWQLRLKSSADLTTEEFRLSRCRQYVANEEEEIGIIPGVRFCLSSMAAADLPDLAFRLTGRRVSPYVLARVWKVEARSSTVRGGGTTLTWKRERVTLMLDERLLREEQLLVQVWMKRAPFADTLLGEATMCLDELVTSRGKAIPTTLELRRPGHRQQGYFSCALSYDIVEAEPGEGSNDTHKEDESFGALRIGVVVNHEAEAAMETVREAQRFARKRRECVDHEKQQQEQERDRASEEIYITHAEEGLALTAAEESEMTTTYYASSSNDEMALIAATSSEDSGYLAQAGVDEATGIPWTRDEWGHRRFFLGFRSEDADSSSS